MRIFKYLDEDGALSSITDNSVIIKSPVEFNDPFDSLFILDEKEKEEAFKIFLNYKLFVNCYNDLFIAKKKPVRLKLLVGLLKEDIRLEANEIKNNKVFNPLFSLSKFYAITSKYLKKSDVELKKTV